MFQVLSLFLRYSLVFSFSLFLGSSQGLQFLDGFAHRLIRLAHTDSMHKNVQVNLTAPYKTIFLVLSIFIVCLVFPQVGQFVFLSASVKWV